MSEEKDIHCNTITDGSDTCCSAGTTTLILACSGGSNVGQIANNIMVKLDRKGVGKAYCLAGIGASLSGFIESAKTAETIVIDGCPVGCARKVFEKYGIETGRYFVVTELGVEKTHDFGSVEEETGAALRSLLEKL
jgi:uncharacterized metal-binding protein